MKRISIINIGLTLLLISGCASIKRLPPPDDFSGLANIKGIPKIRFWGDAPPNITKKRLETFHQQLETDPEFNSNAPVHILALSGGGQNGAYGSGVLTGWTSTGNRPTFRIVTGVSTGALIAPFAFLGPDYDNVIRDMYTRFSTKDVISFRFVRGLFSLDSVADSSPLRKILKRYFTLEEMKLVAQEHRHGRRLYVGTTNLDVQRPVIWDIGAIATSGHPHAYELIIDVLLASAAIPGAFPPVYFKVEQNGIHFDELHVDGGVTTQIFISPVSFNIAEAMDKAGLHGTINIYLIRNAQVSPTVQQVHPKTIPILAQSLMTLLRAQGMGDMTRIYLNSQLEGMEYHATSIPNDFRDEPKETFDLDYMNELFELGYEAACSENFWEHKPPEFSAE